MQVRRVDIMPAGGGAQVELHLWEGRSEGRDDGRVTMTLDRESTRALVVALACCVVRPDECLRDTVLNILHEYATGQIEFGPEIEA